MPDSTKLPYTREQLADKWKAESKQRYTEAAGELGEDGAYPAGQAEALSRCADELRATEQSFDAMLIPEHCPCGHNMCWADDCPCFNCRFLKACHLQKRNKQALRSVCEHSANEGAYYEGKSYVEIAALASLIIQWRARAKRLLEEQPYPGFAGEAEQLDRLAGELEAKLNG